MANIRVTYPIDPKLNHQCDQMHIDSYELAEVMLPAHGRQQPRKAIRVVIHGRNFRAMAAPLVAWVGKQQVQFLTIAPDERSLEGVLLHEPAPGATVDVIIGGIDAARHPTPLDLATIQRIP